MKTTPSRTQRGVTLIESCIVLSIAAVALGVVAPGFEQARERRHLEGVAAQLETDMQYTRSLAVARNQTLHVSLAAPTCYVVHTGASGDCTCNADATASCTAEAQALRVVRIDAVTLDSNSRSIAYDAVKGTVTPTATVKVLAPSGSAIHQVVSLMGRVRSCSPAPGLPGYPRC